MTTPAWIGLGSNLGDRKGLLDTAVAMLEETSGIKVRAVSSYHETPPVGGPPGQGPFLNAAAHLETTLGPHQVLRVLQAIENEAGRTRKVRWGERTLDLDLLIHGTKFLDNPDLKLPHPRLALRRFVVAPLAEIAPTIVDTLTMRTVANLLVNLDRRPRLVAIEGTDGSFKRKIFERLVEELPGFGISAADLAPPSGLEPDDPLAAVFRGVERKAEALDASRWAGESLRVPWIVADYSLDFELIRVTLKYPWMGQTRPAPRARLDADREWQRQVSQFSNAALPPTFILVLPDAPDSKRRPGLARPPILRPESDDPEAIVAEVVATCRGIAGV